MIKRTSGMSFDESQVLAILRAVKAPVQIIRGANGLTLGDETMAARLAALRGPNVTTLEGGHHVHLDRPAEVAAVIARLVDQ